jgi:predicted HTH domain antitoxin
MDLFSAMLLVLSIIVVSTLIAYNVQKGTPTTKQINDKITENLMEEVETKEDINISITQKGDITFKEQAEEAADAVKQVETAKPKKKRKYYPKKKKVQE